MVDKDIKIIKEEVSKLLGNDQTGHGLDHIERVLKLAKKFSINEDVDYKKIMIITYLHDVDDYKLFKESHNAQRILDKTSLSKEDKEELLNSINAIGYSKRLQGIKPNTLECEIVSDADMCEAMGVIGILRAYQYSNINNQEFFVEDLFPHLDMDAKTYRKNKNSPVINHMFEKLLRLNGLLLTDNGKKEGEKRHKIMVDFLEEFFREIDNQEWIDYLNDYIKKISH